MASPSITPVTARIAQSISTAIQQQVASGKKFTGALPQLTGVRANSPVQPGNSCFKYATLAADGGGLFFWNNIESLVCSQIHVDLGAAGDITVSLVNLNPATINDDLPAVLAGEAIIIEQAIGVNFIALDEARFKTILLPYQAIQIVTTATAGAQIAQVIASLEKTYVR